MNKDRIDNKLVKTADKEINPGSLAMYLKMLVCVWLLVDRQRRKIECDHGMVFILDGCSFYVSHV